MGELACAPDPPEPGRDDGDEREDEEGGVDVGDEEGFGEGAVGEYGLRGNDREEVN